LPMTFAAAARDVLNGLALAKMVAYRK